MEPELKAVFMKVMPEASKRTWCLRAWAARSVGEGDFQMARRKETSLREDRGPARREGMGAGRETSIMCTGLR